MKKINVVTVNYLNTKPFLEGLRRSSIIESIKLDIAHPARCADAMSSDEGEIGLVPVAALNHLNNYEIVSDYCLGCDGPVSSVCIFSEIPLNECDTLLLDYQSRTSAALTRYFQNNYWNYNLNFIDADIGYESQIKAKIAGLVIGDRCFSLKDRFTYVVDLGEVWKMKENLPFVFAVWVSKIELDASFKIAFNQALADGVNNLQWSAPLKSPSYDYLKNYISFPFDESKRKAFNIFMQYLKQEVVGV